jgi:hypothetical protein
VANASNLATIGTMEYVLERLKHDSEMRPECDSDVISNLRLDSRKSVAKPISGASGACYLWYTYWEVYMRIGKLLVNHTSALAKPRSAFFQGGEEENGIHKPQAVWL